MFLGRNPSDNGGTINWELNYLALHKSASYTSVSHPHNSDHYHDQIKENNGVSTSKGHGCGSTCVVTYIC